MGWAALGTGAVAHAVYADSINQIPAMDVLFVWWYGLALGAERFEHFTRYHPVRYRSDGSHDPCLLEGHAAHSAGPSTVFYRYGHQTLMDRPPPAGDD